MTPAYPIETILRFSQHISFGDDCWPWTGALFESGYGVFNVTHSKIVRAHRFSFSVFVRPLAPGELACHHCDNKPCVRPLHLFAGTAQDNVSDRDVKGRLAFGERVSTAKLIEDEVRRIRNDPRAQRVIATEYGVCKSTIGYIKRGENWAHVR